MKIPNSRGKSLDALLAKLLRLPEGARLTREEADDLVDSFYEEIRLALESSESVNLAGFGRFERDNFTPSVALTRAVR